MKILNALLAALVLVSMAVPVSVFAEVQNCSDYEGNVITAEPEWYAEQCLGISPEKASDSDLPPVQDPATDIAYAQDIGTISDNFVSHILNDFPGQTVIGTNTDSIYGMDFDSSASTLYALNNGTLELGTIDPASGAFTAIGAVNPLGGHTLTGLTIDPVSNTFYASSTDGVTAALYTLNPSTGAGTLIGTQTTTPFLIDIAMNCSGEMYGHDISTDSIYSINPSDGSATLIGATGVLSNFAQGMDFDNDDGTLYAYTYQGAGSNQYGTVDLATGLLTPLATDNPLGEFEGATMTVCPGSAVAVPTTTEWGMIVFMVFAGIISLFFIRKFRKV